MAKTQKYLHTPAYRLRVVPPFFLRNSRASESRARVKITPREKGRHAAGREKNEGNVGKERVTQA